MGSAKRIAAVAVAVCSATVVLLWQSGGGFEVRAMTLPVAWIIAELSIRFSPPPQSMADFTRHSIAWIGMMLAVALVAKTLIFLDVLNGEGVDFVKRFVGVLLGTGVVLWGNFLPKISVPSSQRPIPALRVHRFMGWSAVLGGIAIIAMYVFAPVSMISTLLVPLVAAIAAVVVLRRVVGVVAR